MDKNLNRHELPGEPEDYKYLKRSDNTFYFCDGKDMAPLKMGDRIVKKNTKEGDNVKNGTLGVIVGSLSSPIECDEDDLPPQYAYAVTWDTVPGKVVSIISNRVKKNG